MASTGSRESQSTAVTSPRFTASGKRCASTRHGPSSISETYTVRASGKTFFTAKSSPPYPEKSDNTLTRHHPLHSTRGIRHRSHPRLGLQNARTGESGLHDARHGHHTWLPSPCCMERSSYAVDQSRGSVHMGQLVSYTCSPSEASFSRRAARSCFFMTAPQSHQGKPQNTRLPRSATPNIPHR